jgi:regulator of sigma E protease
MLTFLAFLFALTLLVSVHEWGHYRVAVALGVKVLRFSVGLGRPVWRWTKPHQRREQNTEFTLGWLPLGGFVMMLDEAQGPLSPGQSHQAFNRQPLWARALIVAAGPLANLVLAWLLLSAAAGWGQNEPMAILSTPLYQSAAEKAGLKGGERVVASAAVHNDQLEPLSLASVSGFGDLLSPATQALRLGQDWALDLEDDEASAQTPRRVRLLFADLAPGAMDAQLSPLEAWGLGAPRAQAIVIRVEPDSPAALAGLKPGDQVLTVQGQRVGDAQFLRQTIRHSVVSGVADPLVLEVSRDNQVLALQLVPAVVVQGQQKIGRMGAVVGATPRELWVAHDALDSLFAGARQTYVLTRVTLRMLEDLFAGQGSVAQLGGPITIADQAGRSAQLGLGAYLSFLGFLSISLGVLNLLPLPMLDGGHLMYYLWELLSGKPVSADWVNGLQKLGLMLLVALMATALVNDGMRLLR